MSKFALIAILVASILAVHVAPLISADGGARDAIVYGLRINPIVNGTNINIYGPGRDLLVEIGGLTANYHITDHLASSRLVIGNSDVARHEYGPHGAVITGGDGARYAGHPYDPHPGVYTTPNRTYDPFSGRFLSADPGRQGASPYPYAGNNPITNVDRQGDIYLPFYIKSGFAPDDDPRRATTGPQAELIRKIIGGANEPEQMVRSDEFFFSRSEDERPGSRFLSWGRTFVQHEFYAGGAMAPQHGDNLYWIVGGEVSVQRPMDVAEVFERWWGLRPELASNIVVVDITGSLNSSAPIREALRTAGILHGFVRARPLDARSNTFRVNGATYNRDQFGLYVRTTAEGLNSHRRALGQQVIQRLMSQQPEASQPPPRRPPYHAQTASDRLPDQTVPEVVPDLLEGATGLGDFGDP